MTYARCGQWVKQKTGYMKTVFFSLLGIFLVALTAKAAGPTSTLYVTDVTAGLNWRILGGTTTPISSPQTETISFGESAIAVSGGVIRTAGNGQRGGERLGSVYDLNFNYVGPRLGNPLNNILDGATDGRYNYGVNYDNGQVFRCGLDWTAPEYMFTVSGATMVGITYDNRNNSLWIANQGRIENYSLSGTLLSTVPTGTLHFILAFDYADNTLWSFDGLGTFRQYDTDTWQVKQTMVFITVGPSRPPIMGGEFELPVPEPTAASLGLLGAVVFAARHFRRK